MPKFPKKTSKEDISAIADEGGCKKKTVETRNRIMETFITFGESQDDPIDVKSLIERAVQGETEPLESALMQFFADFKVGRNDESPKRNTIEAYRYCL